MDRSHGRWLLLAATLISTGSALAQLQSTGTQFWHQGSPGVGIAPEADAEFGRSLSSGDYDCDGLDDVAIGIPREDLIGADDGGRVLVLYGADDGSGLATTGRQIWSQAGPAVPGDPSPFENFGATLASGDFDGDGCDDLAIGVPRDDVNGVNSAGAVHVLYGSAGDGLSADGIDYWHQGPGSTGLQIEADDQFGAALAVGDFDGDGRDDLAIGVPREDSGSGASLVVDAGLVQVLFGTSNGLSTSQSVNLRRGSNLFGSPVSGERLGSVLAAGNLNSIVGDELVIGIESFDLSAALPDTGAIMVVSDIDGNVFNALFTQDSPNIPGAAEAGDRLGSALAIGDFDGNGFDEVAASAAGEDIEQPAPERDSVGVVNVFDFTGGAHQIWNQDDLPPEQAEDSDQFGSALVAADFDGDGIDDLAIGASREDLGPIPNAGLVHVLYGVEGTGLTTAGRQLWLQTIDGSDAQDDFGFALAAGAINAGSEADLVIGAPGNTIVESGAGSATVLYSRSDQVFADRFETLPPP
ncbi:FG-GAP repeat protein [Wenzhouxiangella marina]|uniref:Putative integrin-like protein n=1 Tax=Wenzhouxiangella marina TaxID=1579979 RepID=A0A0K0Y017_9GAMM|nr:FG-GAP repeat protein [Wenzhouxiangella marina]AKS43288.1 Putative integrin-like protein [Wenzhouxiangella marina]MBB6087022.1 hypothetical protein [Wenzhouxiangella marina]